MRAFRWRRDTIAVTSDDEWIKGQGGDISHVAGIILRLRIQGARITPSSGLSTSLRLDYEKNGGADVRITTTSNNIIMVPSEHYANHDPCLNLFLTGGTGSIIDSDNGMHVAGGIQTLSFSFPAAARRFESEWTLFVKPEDVAVGDVFRFFMKRTNGNDFELSPLQIPQLTIVAAGAIDGEGNLGAVVSGSGSIGATVQGAGHLGPSVKGSGIIRPEGTR